jgi:hypothetical protein
MTARERTTVAPIYPAALLAWWGMSLTAAVAHQRVGENHEHRDHDVCETDVKQQPWRKLLYVRQDYPDNYVDSTFLEEMKKNGKMRSRQDVTMIHDVGDMSDPRLAYACMAFLQET